MHERGGGGGGGGKGEGSNCILGCFAWMCLVCLMLSHDIIKGYN